MTQPTQVPSLSRLVHVTLPGGAHRSATVINTDPNRPLEPTLQVELDPFVDTGLTYLDLSANAVFQGSGVALQFAPYDETGQQPWSWHWPERV